MLQIDDLIQETISAPGTAAFPLGTPTTGYFAFSTIVNQRTGAAIANGDTCYYRAYDTAGNTEIGLGTYTTGTPNTLARTTIIKSSAGGTTAVNFTGSTFLFLDVPATQLYNVLGPKVQFSATVAGSGQSFTNGNAAGLNFTSIATDTSNFANGSTTPNFMVIPYTGTYLITWAVFWTGLTANSPYLATNLEWYSSASQATTILSATSSQPGDLGTWQNELNSGVSGYYPGTASAILAPLTAGQAVGVQCQQGSGATQSINAKSNITILLIG